MSYYGCESMKHQEFTCLQYSYFNKKFTRERWCTPCQDTYSGGDNAAEVVETEAEQFDTA
jgi:hypothetical protein